MKPRQRALIRAYAECGILSVALRLADVPRPNHYRWLKDPAYKAAWEEAHEEACEAMEAEARRRAILGVVKPVFYKGRKLRTGIQEYSDTLLIFLLKAAKPEKYRDNVQVEHTGELNLVERLEAGRARLAQRGTDGSGGA